MIRAVTLSNIGANYAAALSDCVCFAEAESRKGACLQAASRSGTCLSAPNALARAPIRPAELTRYLRLEGAR
jgi:hypothetical protein